MPYMAFSQNMEAISKSFAKKYISLKIPEITYDYKKYFQHIPSELKLTKQKEFFSTQKLCLLKVDRYALDQENTLIYDHLAYEIDFNLKRIDLETKWVKNGRIIPQNGLYTMPNYQEWYPFFIQKFIGSLATPEEIMEYGLAEVDKVKKEISQIQEKLGFKSQTEFYNFLHVDTFYFYDKKSIVKAFAKVDSSVRHNLSNFVGTIDIPAVYPMELPDAGPYTPPGMYLNKSQNAFGKDVFQYNFYGKKFNKRALDWIFMHEAVPGHHLQFSFYEKMKKDKIQDLFSYSGNFEGWACYVEYYGKELGVYKDEYSYLGKWEWDLIRSARLVIETGIHYYGWSKEKALEYWKDNVYGQDEIADREITRVTNWPGQALSYKLGAKYIFELLEKTRQKTAPTEFNLAKFHQQFLAMGMRPLPVISKNFIYKP